MASDVAPKTQIRKGFWALCFAGANKSHFFPEKAMAHGPHRARLRTTTGQGNCGSKFTGDTETALFHSDPLNPDDTALSRVSQAAAARDGRRGRLSRRRGWL